MYRLFNSFLLRTPYYPFSALTDLKNEKESVFKEMLQIATSDLNESLEKEEERM